MNSFSSLIILCALLAALAIAVQAGHWYVALGVVVVLVWPGKP